MGAPLRPSDCNRPELPNVVFSSSHATDLNLREKPSKTETSPFPKTGDSQVCAACRRSASRHHVLLARRRQDDGADSEDRSGLELHHRWHGAAAATRPATREIVLYASNSDERPGSAWQVESDPTAAGRRENAAIPTCRRRQDRPRPSANPANYFELTFNAETGPPITSGSAARRIRNNWANDSVFVQFYTVSVTSGGAATWRIGTTVGNRRQPRGLQRLRSVRLGLAGQRYWDLNVDGTARLLSRQTGPQTMRIQMREDGLSIDQIVLSRRRI